ncbi:hypothetical protein GOC60_14775 [Sinorhizobium meliloti]|nr:hypothetical protein [Sinorhizobium meliloti]
MANQNGIFIVLKAWLPVTGSISEQIAKLQMVEKAHASGDYAELLGAAKVEEIKTEQKTRRIEDEPAAPTETEDASGLKQEFDNVPPVGDIDADPVDPAAVPKFLKGNTRRATPAEAAE